MVAFAEANNPYVLNGFEDGALGPNSDFSDAMFAIDIGVGNVNALLGGGANHSSSIPAPESGVIWALVLGAVFQRIRRKRASVLTTVA